MSAEKPQDTGGLSPQYQTYERQKCFIAYTEQVTWSEDLLSACREVLSRSEFNLEPDYARKHFDPDIPLRQKALELIANARYGIYDLSYWRDAKCEWQMPRNVFIELGMAVALNRPTLLIRHASNRELELPECLKSVRGHILEFSGETTLKRALEERLPQWVNAPPDRDWWNRYCIFGGRTCEYREAHPRSKQWGQKALRCHISDGPDVDRDDFRSVVEEVLGRFSDVTFEYLGALPVGEGYDFLMCTHCRTVRSTPFAIYRITLHTSAETFIAIGMSIALESQFEYRIPKILLAKSVQDVPSLLSGYEAVVVRSDRERRARLRTFLPTVMQKVHETAWKPRPLPFIETVLHLVREVEAEGSIRDLTWTECWRLATLHTSAQLVSHAGIFRERLYVIPKESENWLLSRIRDDRHGIPLWIAGALGTGKTSLVCHIAQHLNREQNTATFLYFASDLWGERLKDVFSRAMTQSDNLGAGLESLDAQWRERGLHWRLVLIIDGVNEYHDQEELVQQLDGILALTSGYPWFKLVVFSRPEVFGLVKRSGTSTGVIDLHTLRGLSLSELRDAYERYRIEYELQTPFEQLSAQVLGFIQRPLRLRMMSESYSGCSIPAVMGSFYCAKCREKRVSGYESITMKNGKSALKGKCPVCGTKMFKIVSS